MVNSPITTRFLLQSVFADGVMVDAKRLVEENYLRLLFVFIMLLEGILLGPTLSLMIGPLFFAIVQAALSGGIRAGIAVAVGLWTSDLLFVLRTYFGPSALASFTALPHFRLWAGLLGGLLLVIFGISALLSCLFAHCSTGNQPDRKRTYFQNPGRSKT